MLEHDVLTFSVCPTGCKVLDVHIIKVSRIDYGAFVELESEEHVKLALSCSGQCMSTTYMFGCVFGMCLSFASLS